MLGIVVGAATAADLAFSVLASNKNAVGLVRHPWRRGVRFAGVITTGVIFAGFIFAGGINAGVITTGVVTVGIMTIGFMTVGVVVVGFMTVGVVTVGVIFSLSACENSAAAANSLSSMSDSVEEKDAR